MFFADLEINGGEKIRKKWYFIINRNELLNKIVFDIIDTTVKIIYVWQNYYKLN